MKNKYKEGINIEIKDIKDFCSSINYYSKSKKILAEEIQFKNSNDDNTNNINENLLILKDNVINQINKRLNIYSIFADDSLDNYFSFYLPIYGNLNNIKDDFENNKKIVYVEKINDNDSNDIKSFLNINDLSQLHMNKIKLNFGEDPYKVNKRLNKKFNEGLISNILKDEMSNFIKNLYSFPIFKFKLNNEAINRDYYIKQDFNSSTYDNNNEVPLKYINTIPIIIENNKLLKRNKIEKTNVNIIKNNKENNDFSGVSTMTNNNIFMQKKTSRIKSKEKINNEKSIIYRYNNKFIIPLDEFSFDEFE